MDELDIFIGGQWRRGGGNLMHSQFPADGAINAALHAASMLVKNLQIYQFTFGSPKPNAHAKRPIFARILRNTATLIK